MRTCMIHVDMTSDKSSEAYPVETFCDDCYEAMAPGTEDSPVVQEENKVQSPRNIMDVYAHALNKPKD